MVIVRARRLSLRARGARGHPHFDKFSLMECFPLIKFPTPVPVSYYASCKKKTTTPASLIVARPPSLARPPPSPSLPSSFPSFLPSPIQIRQSRVLFWLPSILFFPRVVAFPVLAAAADPSISGSCPSMVKRSPLLFSSSLRFLFFPSTFALFLYLLNGARYRNAFLIEHEWHGIV